MAATHLEQSESVDKEVTSNDSAIIKFLKKIQKYDKLMTVSTSQKLEIL